MKIVMFDNNIYESQYKTHGPLLLEELTKTGTVIIIVKYQNRRCSLTVCE